MLSLDALIHMPKRNLAPSLKHSHDFELRDFLTQLHDEAQHARHASLRQKAQRRYEELSHYLAIRN